MAFGTVLYDTVLHIYRIVTILEYCTYSVIAGGVATVLSGPVLLHQNQVRKRPLRHLFNDTATNGLDQTEYNKSIWMRLLRTAITWVLQKSRNASESHGYPMMAYEITCHLQR